MEINKAVEILNQLPTITNSSMTYWIKLGQAIEVIKQYVTDKEKEILEENLEKNNSELIDLDKIKPFSIDIDKITEILQNKTSADCRMEPILESKPLITHFGMMEKIQCPKCKTTINTIHKTCPNCNTKIDWSQYTKPDLVIGYKGTKTIK